MFRRSTNLGAAMSGVDFLKNRFTNKGTAFSRTEREHLKVHGLLPPAIESVDEQLARCKSQFDALKEPINKYQLLRSIQDSNNTLYYKFIEQNLEAVLPIIYTPTVGEACQKFGALYQRDHGIYISTQDEGNVEAVVANARRDNIDLVVVTDGSRILGLGDLGTNGMGISIGKCSLYVAGAGVDPRRVLPVMIDAGTNREELWNDPNYMGQRKARCDDATFYAVLDEFMASVQKRWPKAVVQFEDFSNNHCFDMLDRYRQKYRCFNDDIQGTGAVVSAGFFNAIKMSGTKPEDQKLLVFGAGSAAVGVVNSIASLIAFKTDMTREQVLNNVYLFDSKGLVTTTRGDTLAVHKTALARTDVPKEDNANLKDFMSVVKYVKPTSLIGLGASGPVFTEDVVKHVTSYCERPIIFPLSNPTSKSEIDPANAYKWTNGKAIVASGSPYPSTQIGNNTFSPSQGNNMYIFPGIGLGASISQPKTISEQTMVASAAALADMVTDEDMKKTGALYPPLTSIRDVSSVIAAAVCAQVVKEGVSENPELPDNRPELKKVALQRMWQPVYPSHETYMNSTSPQPKPHSPEAIAAAIQDSTAKKQVRAPATASNTRKVAGKKIQARKVAVPTKKGGQKVGKKAKKVAKKAGKKAKKGGKKK